MILPQARNQLTLWFHLIRAVGWRVLGWQPVPPVSLAVMRRLLSDWNKYEEMNTVPSLRIAPASLYPILDDFDAPAGDLSDYFYQDLWASRKIFETRPARHVDVGSRIDGFIAHLLTFMPVEYVDIRMLDRPVRNLTTIATDATSLEAFPDDSVGSLSSLHAAEHFGLGRYSDAIDPMACFRFMSALSRVLAPAGRLYFSVPLGRERVEFNAHRVFALPTILSGFRDLNLLSFSYVDDSGWLQEDVKPEVFPCDSAYCCGMFEFTKERRH